jgi:hypothetical protein
MTNFETIDIVSLAAINGGSQWERRCFKNDRYDGCSGMQQQFRNVATGARHFGPLPVGATLINDEIWR